jgi:hypothetical protein
MGGPLLKRVVFRIGEVMVLEDPRAAGGDVTGLRVD